MHEPTLTWAQAALGANIPMVTTTSVVDGDSEIGIPAPVAEVLPRIMGEADGRLRGLRA
jgi:hypothetical protein